MNIKDYILAHRYKIIIGCLVVLASILIFVVNNSHGYIYSDESIYTETSTQTEQTTLTTEMTTETTTIATPKVHYNADGKLYGKKGSFSGLWPELEVKAKASNEQYIKDLMVYVGDNTELKKSNYENDKFKQINGYGTVHWSQGGHKWPNKYSAAHSGYTTVSNNLFDKIKQNIKDDDLKFYDLNAVKTDNVESGAAIENNTIVQVEEVSTETTTKAVSKNKTVKSSTLAPGRLWGSDSCGVCSLAMALSTLSGVTVSPPEVALAANLLIGKGAWYDTILYSTSQAKLAQLAGFDVKLEPYNQAKKETMDDCLNKNGVALFVSNKSPWVTNGRHYIMVRNKVGDKYYTADSGNNPTGGFSYQELSSGYCQQYIVYIYPKK